MILLKSDVGIKNVDKQLYILFINAVREHTILDLSTKKTLY